MNAQLSGNADVNIKGLFTLLDGWNESISVEAFFLSNSIDSGNWQASNASRRILARYYE